ncbi:methylase of polypeptide chain release factors [Microbacterium testaceum StLB037]|uniref:Methylase of polypeptide chain release factors n=1 Tax=Microbacterium testaceum (strain StLB037) TaxID=979556 RepID=E8N951_MICTS|nr:methyltransferase [Microbacterium testaceum]BAJ74487.1 methylase of polypeptide chain release factors [Microbacterium testaceum StLB037]
MLPEPDPTLCHLLADDLRAAGYGSAALRSAWGPQADDAIARGLLDPAIRALGDRRDPLAVLGRLWGLGRPVPRDDLAAALPAVGISGVVALGLATSEGDTVTPAVLVRPQAIADADGEEEWWIASDLDEAALGGPLPEDHVLGVGGASQTLARLQLTWRAASALDIGTGCGIQALRLRRLVPRVVATDISERALRFTRLNALLNDVDGIETRHGSLFDPVAGETFERVASNPPFVITPRVAGVPAYEYRDGGLEGDALVASVIRGVGAHLAPGGVAQSLGNWEYRDGESGLDRVKGWVDPALDAWVIEREVLDPLAYAELWVRDGGTVPGTPAYARLIDAWLEDFERRGVTGVGFGYVLLRRPLAGAPTLERYERVAGGGEAAFGPHLAACLEEHDRAALLDDDGLVAATLGVSSDVTEARHHRPGEESPSVIELRQGGGFGRTIEVDPALAALVGACDGDLPVGPLIGAIAELLEVDADDLRADLLPRVRELIVTGFLRFLDA